MTISARVSSNAFDIWFSKSTSAREPQRREHRMLQPFLEQRRVAYAAAEAVALAEPFDANRWLLHADARSR